MGDKVIQLAVAQCEVYVQTLGDGPATPFIKGYDLGQNFLTEHAEMEAVDIRCTHTGRRTEQGVILCPQHKQDLSAFLATHHYAAIV
jgi:hypothetical protein